MDTNSYHTTPDPSVTIVIPSYNQADYLDEAIRSVFEQAIPVEAIVVDGGSADHSLEVIQRYESRLHWWRSCSDNGQASAINEGMKKGSAPYVCWLNSDDLLLPGGLQKLISSLESNRTAPAAYGKCLVIDKDGKKKKAYWTARFSEKHLANRCFIAQPATLIRRSAWEALNGLDESLHMSMDYDLWWRLYKEYGDLLYSENIVAASRCHIATKTNMFRKSHYRESMMVVGKYYGTVPLKWYISWPFRVLLWHYYNKVANLRY